MGILLFSFVAVKLGVSHLPAEVSWKHILGAGFLGGIGFTMSIFITLLAFENPEIVQSSKIAILLSSVAAGTVGFLILNRQPPCPAAQSDVNTRISPSTTLPHRSQPAQDRL
jgi:Na+:H+ antiporter, NhaA family